MRPVQVEFGIWDHFERRPGITPASQYQEKITLVQEAERLGFGHYWVAEHHLSPLDLAPSPSVFLAALAQATSTIRIGTGVFVLPLYHPLRLVQEICMLDNLANGRLDVGIGRGVRAIEHEWFGVPRDEVRARHEETLAIVLKGLATGDMAYDGEFYKIGAVPLDVLPVQRPYPPLWYAGGVETAARGGFNLITRGPQDVAKYWQLWDESQDLPGPSQPACRLSQGQHHAPCCGARVVRRGGRHSAPQLAGIRVALVRHADRTKRRRTPRG